MRTFEALPATQLATTLFGQTRRRILALLLVGPGEELYVRQIVRATESSPGAVQRELKALQTAGILTRRARGNQVLYRANRACPIYAELRDILIKTAGLADVLRAALAPLREQIDTAFVFGSMARGDAGPGSDVDLMVVGDLGLGEVAEALARAQERLAREINPVVYSPAEFRRRMSTGDHFVTTILAEAVVLIFGDSDELGGLGTERLVAAAPDE